MKGDLPTHLLFRRFHFALNHTQNDCMYKTKIDAHNKNKFAKLRASKCRGFTLLLATLLSSLLLLLGAAIFNVIKKEIVLSSLGRDSQFAFYAADTGAECALYWDFRFNAFQATSTYTSATCDGQSLGDIEPLSNGETESLEYQTNGLCVRVDVTKNAEHPRTKVVSKGYNTSCASIGTNRRTLERAVELTY